MSSEEIKGLCEEFSSVDLGVGQAADRLLQHQKLVWGVGSQPKTLVEF